jgi:hypothetical protein
VKRPLRIRMQGVVGGWLEVRDLWPPDLLLVAADAVWVPFFTISTILVLFSVPELSGTYDLILFRTKVP